MKILVTGGAGYIGSHTVLELLAHGHDVEVLDNFGNSSAESIRRVEKLSGRDVPLHELDLRDEPAVTALFADSGYDSVIHFAGHKAVGESVAKPLDYYGNNLESTLVLLRAMAATDTRQLVFSSSATVYGDYAPVPYQEDYQPLGANNPYGWTKVMIEQILRDVAAADATWRIGILRYFNPVGAHESGDIGEDPSGIPNNLTPYIAQVAVGRRESSDRVRRRLPDARRHAAARLHPRPRPRHRPRRRARAPLRPVGGRRPRLEPRHRDRHVRPRGDRRLREGDRQEDPLRRRSATSRRPARVVRRPGARRGRARLEGHALDRRHARRPLALAVAEPAGLRSLMLAGLAGLVLVAAAPLTGTTIVIDPGHQLGNHNFPAEINRPVPAGGFTKPCNTTGTATDGGYPEATFAWEVSRQLRSSLTALGATVVMTRHSNREDRWGPCVDVRGRAGNAIDADLKVSVHGDGSYAAGARGFHVIAPTNRAPWTSDIHQPSLRLAGDVRTGLLSAGFPVANYIAGGDGLDVRSDLGTLNLSDVPTVMVELGNMRNAAEARVMTTSAGQARYASGLAAGVRRFLR